MLIVSKSYCARHCSRGPSHGWRAGTSEFPSERADPMITHHGAKIIALSSGGDPIGR